MAPNVSGARVTPRVLAPVKGQNAGFIVAGVIAFPVTWLILIVGQGTYFGPMRSLFTKITRRYLDTLPFGWTLFDVLFYLLPVMALVLIGIGLSMSEGVNARYVAVGGVVSVLIVLVIRSWSPGYL